MAVIPILFRLQEIETRLNALQRIEQDLSRDSNMLALEELAKEIRSRLADRTQKTSENKKIQKKLELECQRCLEHYRQEETLLYSGKISNPRELEQIQQKMGEYRQLQDKLEMEILSLLEVDEKLNSEIADLEARLTRCMKELTDRQKINGEKKLELQLEREQLHIELEAITPQIPVEWMARYRKIADSHRGIGIAQLKGNVCGACHVSLSDSLLKKVKQGDDCLYFCENCGRIIYY